MSGDEPVAHLYERKQEREAADPGRPRPPKLLEDEEHGGPGPQDRTASRHDVDGLRARRAEGRIRLGEL